MRGDPASEAEMKVVKLPVAEARAAGAPVRRSAIPVLLWCEWFAHSRLLLSFIAAWLAGVWVAPFFVSPGWILLLGGVYALIAGPIYGGGDTLEGCEEFTLALPPTRRERYLARLTVGAGTLILLTALDLLALGLDLPQFLAKVYVDAGLVRPWPVMKPGLLYGLVLALPLAVFAFSFALAAVTHSRMLVWTTSFWATVLALGILWLGFWYEEFVWDKLNGYFACPLLTVFGLASLVAGDRAYARKEVGHQSVPLSVPPRLWLWIFLFIAGVLLALRLAASLARHFPKFLLGA
jgi:hypothetical protein